MMTHWLAASIALSLSSFAALAQAPDVLVPSGSVDGFYALVDKDTDGAYTVDGEAYDFYLAAADVSPQTLAYDAATKTLYWVDPVLDALMVGSDTNANGLLEASEVGTWFDVAASHGGNTGPRACTLDPSGWLWWTNTTGTKEGLFRSKDLNNDGDAEDPGETVDVLVEGMPAAMIPLIGNSTNTPALALTGLDQIVWDGSVGSGRLLLEEEATDTTIALEDKNADGDFLDVGECYLVLMVWSAGSLLPDQNPDVGTVLPVCNELRGHAVDVASKKIYLVSADTNAANADTAIVLVGLDANADGDINDAGETTIFFDGSLDSTGAVSGYNFTYSCASEVVGGVLYVAAEFDGAPDQEHLLRLEDFNADGDANDAGEAVVVWNLGTDRAHYTPLLLPAGSIAAPATLPAVEESYGDTTCITSGSGAHVLAAPEAPVLGQSFSLVSSGMGASVTGAYGIGVTQIPAGVPLDGGGTCRVYQSFDLVDFGFTADMSGDSSLTATVPMDPTLVGLNIYWQSVSVDAAAPAAIGLTLSNGLWTRLGGYTYTR